MSAKSLLVFLIALLIFTQDLITIHYSNFEKSEYDRICNNLYTEKVWIDKCYLPYQMEIQTFETARAFEIAGIIITGIFFLNSRFKHKKK